MPQNERRRRARWRIILCGIGLVATILIATGENVIWLTAHISWQFAVGSGLILLIFAVLLWIGKSLGLPLKHFFE